MREILFKAKRIDNGEWVEGSFVKAECLNGISFDYVIIEVQATGKGYNIDENTLCQYTGLTDKNGNKIWENDIVEEDWGTYKGAVHFGLFENQVLKNMGFNIHWFMASSYRQDLPYWTDKIEVIGNIFDNPELLEGGGEV